MLRQSAEEGAHQPGRHVLLSLGCVLLVLALVAAGMVCYLHQAPGPVQIGAFTVVGRRARENEQARAAEKFRQYVTDLDAMLAVRVKASRQRNAASLAKAHRERALRQAALVLADSARRNPLTHQSSSHWVWGGFEVWGR